MSPIKPLTLHSHPGPNPWKIAILLEELNVPYTTVMRTTSQLKEPDFLAINRAGQSPVIEDPNTGLVLAESGAIMDYLTSEYDGSHKISFADLRSKYLMKQWIDFQTNSQGPFLRRIFYWSIVAPTPIPEARAGYVALFRDLVLRVLNEELAGKDWLVGGKCSAADLSYVPFQAAMAPIMGESAPDMEREYPNVEAWYNRMASRDSCVKIVVDQREALKFAQIPAMKFARDVK